MIDKQLWTNEWKVIIFEWKQEIMSKMQRYVYKMCTCISKKATMSE